MRSRAHYIAATQMTSKVSSSRSVMWLNVAACNEVQALTRRGPAPYSFVLMFFVCLLYVWQASC
jgi:hypothetical protein